MIQSFKKNKKGKKDNVSISQIEVIDEQSEEEMDINEKTRRNSKHNIHAKTDSIKMASKSATDTKNSGIPRSSTGNIKKDKSEELEHIIETQQKNALRSITQPVGTTNSNSNRKIIQFDMIGYEMKTNNSSEDKGIVKGIQSTKSKKRSNACIDLENNQSFQDTSNIWSTNTSDQKIKLDSKNTSDQKIKLDSKNTSDQKIKLDSKNTSDRKIKLDSRNTSDRKIKLDSRNTSNLNIDLPILKDSESNIDVPIIRSSTEISVSQREIPPKSQNKSFDKSKTYVKKSVISRRQSSSVDPFKKAPRGSIYRRSNLKESTENEQSNEQQIPPKQPGFRSSDFRSQFGQVAYGQLESQTSSNKNKFEAKIEKFQQSEDKSLNTTLDKKEHNLDTTKATEFGSTKASNFSPEKTSEIKVPGKPSHTAQDKYQKKISNIDEDNISSQSYILHPALIAQSSFQSSDSNMTEIGSQKKISSRRIPKKRGMVCIPQSELFKKINQPIQNPDPPPKSIEEQISPEALYEEIYNQVKAEDNREKKVKDANLDFLRKSTISANLTKYLIENSNETSEGLLLREMKNNLAHFVCRKASIVEPKIFVNGLLAAIKKKQLEELQQQEEDSQKFKFKSITSKHKSKLETISKSQDMKDSKVFRKKFKLGKKEYRHFKPFMEKVQKYNRQVDFDNIEKLFNVPHYDSQSIINKTLNCYALELTKGMDIIHDIDCNKEIIFDAERQSMIYLRLTCQNKKCPITLNVVPMMGKKRGKFKFYTSFSNPKPDNRNYETVHENKTQMKIYGQDDRDVVFKMPKIFISFLVEEAMSMKIYCEFFQVDIHALREFKKKKPNNIFEQFKIDQNYNPKKKLEQRKTNPLPQLKKLRQFTKVRDKVTNLKHKEEQDELLRLVEIQEAKLLKKKLREEQRIMLFTKEIENERNISSKSRIQSGITDRFHIRGTSAANGYRRGQSGASPNMRIKNFSHEMNSDRNIGISPLIGQRLTEDIETPKQAGLAKYTLPRNDKRNGIQSPEKINEYNKAKTKHGMEQDQNESVQKTAVEDTKEDLSSLTLSNRSHRNDSKSFRLGSGNNNCSFHDIEDDEDDEIKEEQEEDVENLDIEAQKSGVIPYPNMESKLYNLDSHIDNIRYNRVLLKQNNRLRFHYNTEKINITRTLRKALIDAVEERDYQHLQQKRWIFLIKYIGLVMGTQDELEYVRQYYQRIKLMYAVSIYSYRGLKTFLIKKGPDYNSRCRKDSLNALHNYAVITLKSVEIKAMKTMKEFFVMVLPIYNMMRKTCKTIALLSKISKQVRVFNNQNLKYIALLHDNWSKLFISCYDLCKKRLSLLKTIHIELNNKSIE